MKRLLNDKLIKECVSIIGCDTARISVANEKMFLIIGYNKNTKNDETTITLKNGERYDFDYVEETVIASGNTEQELIDDAKEYKRLSKMNMADYIAEIIKKQQDCPTEFSETANKEFWKLI